MGKRLAVRLVNGLRRLLDRPGSRYGERWAAVPPGAAGGRAPTGTR